MKSLQYTVDLKKREDVQNEPAWSARVDRWYQLDELGFSFCEALHHWNYLEGVVKPDAIFLSLDGASNIADQDFIASQSSSPAKFVYTLPNIAAAIIFQMLKTHGKVFCLSQGAETKQLALEQAQLFAELGKTVWVLSSRPDPQDPKARLVEFQNFTRN
jgi:hypothetical protein